MQRKLRRFIQLKKDEISKTNDFIIVHTEEEFNEKFSQNPPEMKNIHYLIQNQNHFVWKKSSGGISALKKYLLINEECEESIEEAAFFHKNNDKVLIISAEPGMGKSFILDNFTQQSTADNFFLKIILNTCTKALKELKNSRKPNDWIGFILKSLLNKTDQQEILLLKHLAKEEKLILMFDGLDEVNDYKEQVIHLIDSLNKDKDYSFKKILITTRNHLREELEDHFKTFSFNLNNFDVRDQKGFLVKYWRSLNSQYNEEALSANKFVQSAEDLIARLESISSQNLNELIGIPLQTKMLADIYFEKAKNQEDFSKLIITKLTDLYNQFIESKINIQFEKSGIEIERNQELFEDEKEKFYANHIKLSSSILFESSNNKEDNDFKEQDESLVIKYGVIVAFTNKTPTFLHQSFAEFFLAKRSWQKIKEQNKKDTELEQILRKNGHFLIRRFLNDLMENDEYQKDRKKSKKTLFEFFNNFQIEMENCLRENLFSLLKYLIEVQGVNLKTKNEFLIMATRYSRKDIVAFLLEKGIDVNQQNKDGYSALIVAITGYGRGLLELQLEIVKILKNQSVTSLSDLELRKDIVQILLQNENIQINHQDKDGKTALIVASKLGRKDIVDNLLQHKDIQINKQDDSRRTALIEASQNGHAKVVEMLLQHENIDVTHQDKNASTALILASHQGHKEIVQMLLQEEKTDINQQDRYDSTALIVASKQGHKEIVQMLLQHKNIEVNEPDENGYTALMWASGNGHKEIEEMLLQHIDKKQINQERINGHFSLVTASREAHKEFVEILLKDINIKINQHDQEGNTALIAASEEGHKEIVEMLLKQKNLNINQQNEDGYTALMFASERGHKEIVQMLLQVKKTKINRIDKESETALIKASYNGLKDIVHMLLQYENIKINQEDEYGYTALMRASSKGHSEIVEMLLQHKNIRINQRKKGCNTALMEASEEGHTEVVEILLQHKNIKINQQLWNGKTALMYASERGHKEVVQILLQHKDIIVNHRDKSGSNALIEACDKGHKEIVQMLLEHKNIQINQKDKDGLTALIAASKQGHQEIVEMLLQNKNIVIQQHTKLCMLL
jgi:ankyrin repeat protein/flavodoxin